MPRGASMVLSHNSVSNGWQKTFMRTLIAAGVALPIKNDTTLVSFDTSGL